MKRLPPPTGVLLYHGPSEIDGAPIVVIATFGTRNPKTGPMVQTWILRQDRSPGQAIRDGSDRSICGDCPMRPGADGKVRRCYVNPMGPASVWKAYSRGMYPQVTPAIAVRMWGDRMWRLGSYGDPAAVPARIWAPIVAGVASWTGYTHQWRDMPAVGAYAMASVETPEGARDAWAAGLRTFRVRAVDASGTPEPLLVGEIACPASDEAGHRVSCADCRLCQGTAKSARNIAIIDHGASARARRHLPMLTAVS